MNLWNNNRWLFLILVAFSFWSACHPKVSPRLEEQLKEGISVESDVSRDSLPTLVTILEEPPLVEVIVPKGPYTLLRLEKTACYGDCPVFEVKLYSDGRTIWHGEHYCERIGYYEAFLPKMWRDHFLDRAKGIQFFSFLNHYPTIGPYLSDLPTTVIYLHDGEQEKSITQNYLTPLKLLAFEVKILEIMETLEWRKIEMEEG